MASDRISLLCDVLDNQRNLTKWYLRKVPDGLEGDRPAVGDVRLNSPYWHVAHLIWTDFYIGLKPLGYSTPAPEWTNAVGFGSSGEVPESVPPYDNLLEIFDEVHAQKLEFLRKLDDAVLDADYAIPSLRFKNNYYAVLHLARHEGVHCGNIAAFCKLHKVKTV